MFYSYSCQSELDEDNKLGTGVKSFLYINILLRTFSGMLIGFRINFINFLLDIIIEKSFFM